MTQSLPIPLTSPLSAAQRTMLINLVRRAARAEIMPRFRNLSESDIAIKSNPQDLVTEADIAAEAMIARGVQALFPHALVVGEESVARSPDLRSQIGEAELAFVIDPVDGTWNFVNGLSLFGVILSVTRFGKPVFALLYDPVMDDWIIADETTPAALASSARPNRPVSTSKGGRVETLSGYLHYYLMPQETQEQVSASLPRFARVASLRCSCHEYRMLAQGGVDFVLSGVLNPWDHAAGILACQKAGGYAAMLDGRDYNAGIEDGYILAACNAETWAHLQEEFAYLLKDETT